MEFKGIDIDELIIMGKRMVAAHEETESIMTAIDLYRETYPEADPEVLALLWIGINCKDRQHLID